MALVTQDAIPKSGQIKKKTPSQTSNIQQNLGSPPSGEGDNFPNPQISMIKKNMTIPPSGDGDNFVNNDNRIAWHSVHHSHKLNNGEGEVKFGKGIPNHTEIVSWTAGSTTMKNFRPIKDRYNSSRIQANLDSTTTKRSK